MLDRQGDVVWFRPAPVKGLVKDFNVQTYRGMPVLTWWESGLQSTNAAIGEGTGYIADASYNIVATVRAGHGLHADFHEFNITTHGTALITAFRPSTTDLSPLGGSKSGIVYSGIAQEIDIATGDVIFEWDSLRHVGVTETLHHFYPGTRTRPFDYFHINSIGVAHDGDLLISGRNTCAVYKVDRVTGAVKWRLGGRRSDFKMGSDATFWWQHDVREYAPGVLSIFDNAADPAKESRSRAILLKLGTGTKRATLQRAYPGPRGRWAVNQGSVQVLPGGGVFVGWGSEPYFTQFTASGRPVLSGQLPEGDWSYRAFAANWTGNPGDRPAVVAQPGPDHGSVVYVSWNGATEVAKWAVFAGVRSDALRLVGTERKAGFETAITVPIGGPYFGVTALDPPGHVIGRSATVRRTDG